MAFAERTFWVYPWDIADEDAHDRLKDVRSLGATAISIPFSYHSLRALAPHRFGRKVISTTAAICFQPRSDEFPPPGIQPFCSEWATEQGPIPHLDAIARELDLGIRAWIVVFHSTPLATAHPDSAITNCFGDVFSHSLCPSAPKSHDYALRLVRAVASRPIDAIELEAVGFYGYEHLSHHDKCGIAFDLFHHFLFSCCFCPHCQRNLRSVGQDPDFISERFRHRLLRFFNGEVPAITDAAHAAASLAELLEENVAAGLLQARNHCVLGLLREIREIVSPKIELTVSSGLSPFECSALFGAYPKETLEIVDRLLLVAFESNEQAFRKRFDDAMQCFPDPSRWIAGLRIFPPDASSEEAIASRLRLLQNTGIRAAHLYHYGLAPRHLLAAASRAWR